MTLASPQTRFAARVVSTLGSLALVVAGLFAVATQLPANAVQYPQSQVVSDDPVGWTPWVDNGWIQSFAQVGNRIIAGGSFTSVRAPGSSTAISRTHLFSFDATTGAIDPNFAPTLDGAVNAVEPSPDGQSVIVGGQFNVVNGQSTKIAKISVSNGALVAGFSANVSGGPIVDMVVRGNTLYVGGRFNRAGGTDRPHLAAFNATTGALDNRLNSVFSGTINGGTTYVDNLDVTPDGSRMVVIGNFTTIDGQSRAQLAQFDLTTNPFTLANWRTTRLQSACSNSFPSYVEDVDYSPDGSYFALVTTGAFRGGVNAGVMCDTASRWETYSEGTTLQPTWIDYAGGDTQVGVAVTATAVYTTGHQRWENNPYVGDAEGPGAVSRLGLAALDPINGLPFSWNPRRSVAGGSMRGTFLATAQGLWFGTDVTSIGGETHHRLAFFSLSGGTTIPPAVPGSLPNTLYSFPQIGCSSVDQSILYRVNTGGPAVASLDCGPGWSADSGSTNPLRNSGSRTSSWTNAFTVRFAPTGPVPQSTPSQVFQTERWDPTTSPEMAWNLPVSAGTPIQVRLYFANQCDCTGPNGTPRVFDVVLDGSVVLNDFNILTDSGHRVGTMKSFNITSDGAVNIDFLHVSENPLINAIEIVRTDIPYVQPTPQTFLVRRSFNGSTAGSPTNVQTPSVDWRLARGAFMLNGILYTGSQQDGNLYARTFNGTTLGPATLLFPYVVSPGPVFASVTGMFYANGSIYYTVAGDATMHTRYFTPESGVVGAVPFNVPANGFNWSQTSGITMADGKLYWATPDGNLHSAVFSGAAPQAGTDTVVSGPATGDGQTWGGNGMFVLSLPSSGDTQAPTAPSNLQATSVTATQVGLSWNASSDNVGVTGYDVYRGGTLVATAPGTQTTHVDTTVAAGTFYSYQVFARDAAGNVSAGSNQVNVTTPSTSDAFADGFESGDLSNWTASQGMTVQSADVLSGNYAALATSTGTPAFARRVLSATYPALNYRAAFKIVSQGSNSVNLLRLQSGSGSGILTLFRNSAGNLMLRNDVTATNVSSSVSVAPGVWHQAEMRVTIAGASSTVQVLLDGTPVNALTQTLNLGTAPIGRLFIGDTSNSRTFEVVFDEVIASASGGDTQSPAAPANLEATTVTASEVDLAWDASTDNVGVTSYEVRRNGSPIDTVAGSQTTYDDTSVSQGTSYTYQVFARDAAGNTSPGSNQVSVTTPSISVVFSDGFESGNLSNWTASQGMSVQSADVFAGGFAALASSSGTPGFARVHLPSTHQTVDYEVAFKVVSQGSNSVNLLRLQAASGGGILTLFRSSAGNLMLRNDAMAANVSSSVAVSTGAWHLAEVRVTINGASSTVQVLLDGVQVNALTRTLNLGTAPIGRLFIGDNSSNRTFQVVFDEVIAT